MSDMQPTCDATSQVYDENAVTIDMVRRRLVEAGTVLLCLRDWRGVPADLADYWRHVSFTVLESGDLWGPAAFWAKPDAAEIARMWESWGWLRWLPPEDGQLVLARSFQPPGDVRPLTPWSALAARRRQRISETKDDLDRALARIATHLAREGALAEAAD